MRIALVTYRVGSTRHLAVGRVVSDTSERLLLAQEWEEDDPMRYDHILSLEQARIISRQEWNPVG